MDSSPLDHACQLFSDFSHDSLEILDRHYDRKVHFKDPLNEAFEIEGLKKVFEDTLKQLKHLEFHILFAHGDPQSGLIRWRMHYQMRGKSFDIDGVTELHFSEAGLISRQEDFWDASSPVYGQFPGVGLAIRGIRKLVQTKG